MIKVTTVCGEKYLVKPNEHFSNAEELANLAFFDNYLVRIAYVTSTTGVIISTKHIVTVEDVKE